MNIELLQYLRQFVNRRVHYSSATRMSVPKVSVAGANGIRPMDIRAGLVGRYSDFVDRGLADDLVRFTEGLVVRINAQDPSQIDVDMPLIANALRRFRGRIQFQR